MDGEKVTIRFPGIFDTRFNMFSDLLVRLLGELDLSSLSEILLISLKEIVSNCVKAHAKRMFFHNISLDPEKPDEYARGMQLYPSAVLEEWDTFIRENPLTHFEILIHFSLDSSHLTLQVENNAAILKPEWERINQRVKIFREVQNMEDAMARVQDVSEGAGLGIVLTLMLLSRAGLPLENFRIQSRKGSTFTSLTIPLELTPLKTREKFRDLVIAEINDLPSFPENISRLINLCSSEFSTMQSIAGEIEKDPALTAQVFKLVNSAGYINRFESPSLVDAVKIIGLKVLRNLLIVMGARNVINSRYRYRELEAIWENSNRVSFFARSLSRRRHLNDDTASVAGLLHELGKIVLVSMKPALITKINDLILNGRIRNSWPIEEVELGISHPEVGALLGEKWHFPEALVMAIRNQQKPLHAPEQYRDLIYTTYLAIRLQEASENMTDYSAVEEEILQIFQLDSRKQFLSLVHLLDENYQKATAESR